MFAISITMLLATALLSTRSFCQLAQGQAKFLGNVLSNYDVSSGIPSNFIFYWNQVTPGDAGKFGSIAGSPDSSSWNWGPLDAIYNYAVNNGIPFKEHNLVWGQQQPSWISTLDSAHQYQAVEKWIRLCGERYPEAAMVDVVNEPLHDNIGQTNPVPYINALGGSGSTGWDWVVTAFMLAREYFPNAKLLINEYGILSNRQAVLQYMTMVNILKQRNLIDGVGEEGHSLESVDSTTLRTNLELLATTGVPIYITEYDVNIQTDSLQLGVFQKQFPIFWNSKAVNGVTLWGYIYNDTWKPYANLIGANGKARPALIWLAQYVADHPAAVKESAGQLALDYTLNQNYPNPFNPTTQIRYSVPQNGFVSLKVYNVLGQEVATLFSGVQHPGNYTAAFDGSKFASGVYFYRLSTGSLAGEAGSVSIFKKMILLK